MERWEVMEVLALITNQRLSYIHSLLLSDDRVEFFEGGFKQIFIPTSIVLKAIDTLAKRAKPANLTKLEEFRTVCELTLQPLTVASSLEIQNFRIAF